MKVLLSEASGQQGPKARPGLSFVWIQLFQLLKGIDKLNRV
jgi:hypothetical protein